MSDPHVEGTFSLVDGWRLQGWCFRPSNPTARSRIAILVNGEEVARCTASERNDMLKAAGMGDGRYGFGLKVPEAVGALGTGEKSVEAVELETGTLLGRVLFHAATGVSAAEHRLQQAEAAVADIRTILRHPTLIARGLALAFEAFGGALGQDRGYALRGPTSRSLPQPPPDVSILFLAGTPQAITAAAAHARAVLHPAPVEILLVCRTAPHTLLVRAIPGLRLAGSLQDAASMASAKLLAIVPQAESFIACAIPDHEAGTARGPGPDGIACLIPCTALAAIGGLPTLEWEALAHLLAAADIALPRL